MGGTTGLGGGIDVRQDSNAPLASGHHARRQEQAVPDDEERARRYVNNMFW
jgi:hypothetical protein